MRGRLHISQCSVPGWFMKVQCWQAHMAAETAWGDPPMAPYSCRPGSCTPTVPAGRKKNKTVRNRERGWGLLHPEAGTRGLLPGGRRAQPPQN